MKIIGYGICGPGEASRYLHGTLDCFARLCDEVIILCNNTGESENKMIDSYGFKRVSDRREWGRFQWRIKQDFIERDIKQTAMKGDMLVCLDMDEVLDEHLTKEWIRSAPLDAYHVFVVDMWGIGYKPESCFWNVRMWRWNGETKFKVKPVHCGLAPEWTYHYHRHAPFILKHYGLMRKEDRMRRVERYKKYDPNAEHLDRKYYNMLEEDTFKPFDEEAIHNQIAKEVAAYKQTKPRENMVEKKKPRFAFVKNPHGDVVDIPERDVKETLARKGFEFIGWADEEQDEIDAMFEGVEVNGDDSAESVGKFDPKGGAYQRPAADEAAELDELNKKSDITAPKEEKPLSFSPKKEAKGIVEITPPRTKRSTKKK